MELQRSCLYWCVAILFGVYLYLKHVVYNYWGRKGVAHDKATIPLGNVPFSYFQGKIPHGSIFLESYRRFKKHRFYGLYLLHEPILVVNDPELIQRILVKNFASFYNRGSYNNELKDPLSASLPRLTGDKWKRLRNKLSPTFTSGKLKRMYPLLSEISDELVKALDDALRLSDVVEMKEVSSRFTIDCISTIAFGFNCNSLRNPGHEFHKLGRISNDFGKVFVLLSFYVPSLIKFCSVPEKRKRVQAFFSDLFKRMLAHRRNDNVVRNDFLSMLMQLMDTGKVEGDEDQSSSQEAKTAVECADDKLSTTEAVAQAVIFFAAGQETTSSAISCCLHELAQNPEVQEKLQSEIDEAFASPEGLTYDKLVDMKYLDMVLCETLRKHPGTPVLNRICGEDFRIPGFEVEKGTRLVIPITGLHTDPDIYPNPDTFDPTRFSPENRQARHPFVYLPFGEGPRICIGKRLGILKPKIALCYLLRNYKFSACGKTQARLSYMNNFFVQVPAGGVYLRVERR